MRPNQGQDRRNQASHMLKMARISRRTTAAIAVGLLLAGCAGSPAGGQPVGAPSAPPSRSSPTASQVGIARSADAVAVGALVRGYLEADSQRDYARMASMTTGTIKQFWQWYDLELG